jgi:hypothetical protein
LSATRHTAGYVTVETVIIFPAFFTIFMTFVQLAYLEVAALTTEHATVTATRAASVILADDPRFYDTRVGVAGGKRLAEITEAATLPLRVAADRPKVTVTFPGGNVFREGDQVKLRTDFEAPCTVPIGRFICGLTGTRHIVREATMPYQGAGYTFR